MQKEGKIRLIQGNEAIVEGAIKAGVRFFAGYPITPSTEILEGFALRLPQVGGVFIQTEDEIASLAAVLGASAGGMKAITATSGPGISLMVENIGLAIMEEIPCVIVDIQRMGPATGLIYTSQGDSMFVKWGTPGGNEIIALSPSSVKETFELTIKAVNLSERFRVPVFLVSDALLGHLREKVDISPEKIEIVDRVRPSMPPDNYLSYDADETGVPAMADLGSEYRPKLVSSIHDKAGRYDPSPEGREFLLRRLRNKILAHLDEILMTEQVMVEDAEIVVFAYGICARAAKAAVVAVRREGIRAGLFRPITIWPFPTEAVSRLAKNVKRIIVAEMNFGQLVGEVERANNGKAEVSLITQNEGNLFSAQRIINAIKEACRNA